MPPLMSGSDSAGSDSETMIIAKKNSAGSTKASIPVEEVDHAENDEEDNDENDAEDEEGEDGEDEYIVEKIKSHLWDPDDRCIKYETKWLGWDNPEDITWEPKENLEGARQSLEEYWEQNGGRDKVEQIKPSKKRGRQSAGAGPSDSKKARTSPSQSQPTRRGRKSEPLDDPDAWGPADNVSEWEPPKLMKDAWEDLIIAVETIEPDEQGSMWAYLRWSIQDSNGKHRHTRHPLHSVYKAAPQTMLKFYEKHLVFSDKKAKAND